MDKTNEGREKIRQANQLIKENQYEQAIDCLNEAIKCKDTQAFYILGTLYANGNGCKKNAKKAIALFNKAIKAGHDDALCNLGKTYLEIGEDELAETKYLEYLKAISNRSDDEIKKYRDLIYEKLFDYFTKEYVEAFKLKGKKKDKRAGYTLSKKIEYAELLFRDGSDENKLSSAKFLFEHHRNGRLYDAIEYCNYLCNRYAPSARNKNILADLYFRTKQYATAVNLYFESMHLEKDKQNPEYKEAEARISYLFRNEICDTEDIRKVFFEYINTGDVRSLIISTKEKIDAYVNYNHSYAASELAEMAVLPKRYWLKENIAFIDYYVNTAQKISVEGLMKYLDDNYIAIAKHKEELEYREAQFAIQKQQQDTINRLNHQMKEMEKKHQKEMKKLQEETDEKLSSMRSKISSANSKISSLETDLWLKR